MVIIDPKSSGKFQNLGQRAKAIKKMQKIQDNYNVKKNNSSLTFYAPSGLSDFKMRN